LEKDRDILFITTANLATNPRLLKEIYKALELQYKVSVILFKLGNWSDAKDLTLAKELNEVDFFYISATRRPFLPWVISSIAEKLSKKILSLYKPLWLQAIASNKRTFLLLNYLSNHHVKYQLIVGHNLGALYPAYWFASKTNAKFAFDVEDYHPGEKTYGDPINEVRRRETLMRTLLHEGAYTSFASPLIKNYTLTLNSKIENQLLVNNVFSEKEFVLGTIQNPSKVNFVWFSQNISYGRGLELIISVLELFKDKVFLTLIGNQDQRFVEEYVQGREAFIKIENPLNQMELHKKLSEFDIGLAIDVTAADFNRNIALTNKIWAYFQSGLFILATDTEAQVEFMNNFPQAGIVAAQNTEGIQKSIEYLIKEIESIRIARESRYLDAKKYSWEKESQKLENTWKEILQK
jgi:glycosyltransferase involved in cell wall biosynthesis